MTEETLTGFLANCKIVRAGAARRAEPNKNLQHRPGPGSAQPGPNSAQPD